MIGERRRSGIKIMSSMRSSIRVAGDAGHHKLFTISAMAQVSNPAAGHASLAGPFIGGINASYIISAGCIII